MFFRRLIFVIIILLLIISPGIAVSNIESSPNYLVLLIHGMGSDHKIFTGESKIALELFGSQYPIAEKGYAGNLKKYLEDDLGLAGYVYAYDFSDNRGMLENMGWELGDRNYHNPDPGMEGLCWMEKAKKDFIAANPGKIVPDKFILIAHSMGGMAVRHYLSGKDGAGNPYYKDDVVKVITIGTPHMGTGTANVAKLNEDFWAGTESVVAASLGWQYVLNKLWSKGYSVFNVVDIGPSSAPYGQGLDIAHPNNPLDYLDWKTNYLDAAAINSAFISPALIITIKALFGTPPAINDLLVDSPIVKELKESKLVDKSIKFRLVGGRGIPTPQYNLTASYLYARPLFGVHPTVAFMTSDLWKLPTNQQKIESLMLSFSGAVFNQDGDLLVPIDSALAIGVNAIKDNDIKTYSYTFKDEELEVFINNFPTIFVASKAAYYLAQMWGTPEWVARGILLIPMTSLSIQLAQDMDDIKNNLFGHGRILKEVYGASLGGKPIIDQTLDDTPLFGGNTSTTEVKTGISASAVNMPTASFNDYEQVFELLSNLDKVGKATDVYHTVTIEAITETNSNLGMAFPVVVDSTKKIATAVTVKEPPTAIKGVINTFLPKKLKSFEYSENFAAWKPVGQVDEWGNFTIKDLKLAEGQNIIAFRAESWIGNKSHQHLKIILNTIPMQPSQFKPVAGSYINNDKPEIAVEFNKSEYSGNYEDEKITIKQMLVDGEEVSPQIDSKIENYHPWAKASYTIPADKPLADGEHQVAVKAESNVGIAQGLWSFYVDRSPPTISIEAIAPYSFRAPTTIRYNVSDEVSPNLLSVSCDLYDQNNKFIINIATAETLSKGENFFTLMPGNLDASIPDGLYSVHIKVHDLAGNASIATTDLLIDSTAPQVLGVDVSPNPMTSNTTELGLTAKVNERSTIIIKLNNKSNNTTTAYLTQALTPLPLGEGTGVRADYLWKYDQMFGQGPEDGIYRVEVIARDDAGNESAPRTLEAVVIDRTPPKIYGQITQPYVLANSGKNAYKTTLSYNLSDAAKVKIKVYNANTSQLVETINDAPSLNDSKNEIPWYGGDPKYPKGAYRLQIIVEDKYGNIGVAYASCVKDGIAPEISYPVEDNTVVSGTISIRGTAIDPDWTNDKPFKDYRVYYKKGGDDWKTDFIEVPQVNRDPKDPKNISIRPLQNNSTLAYLYTNNLENGDYTIKVEVNEENGESLSATRLIKINNDSFSAALVQLPYIKLKTIPSAVEFKSDDSIKLPIGFINSVKPANVYVEVIKTGSFEAPVYFKYFPNILGAPFSGKPDYKPGNELGYFIWSDDDGYHLRWSADGSNHKFTGNIILTGGAGYSAVKTIGSGIKVQTPLISWDTSISGGEGGIDFKVASGQLMISPKIEEDPTNPSVYADSVFLGISKYTQQYLPIIIDVAGQKLVDITSMGKPAEANNYFPPAQLLEWNGKYDTGAYVDNGIYTIRVRAEGIDGIGVATDEALVEIKTPFELANVKVDPADKNFSTTPGGIDRVTVSYNVSKDSIINADVFDKDGNWKSTLLKDESVLGSTNSSNPLKFVWKGNYPGPDSGQVVSGGSYKIKMNVTAKDGSGVKNEEIGGISIVKYEFNDQVVLDPLGEETSFNNGSGLENIRLAQGESPFYFEAMGIGKYHPPKDFSYTLSASGKQKITAYPYVPFAALMHRRFNKVRITVKTGAQGVYAASKWGWGGWERDKDTPFTYISRTSNDVTLTTDSSTFELSDSAGSDDLFGVPTGVNQPSRAFVKLEIPITFYAQDDNSFELDTFTIHDDDFIDGTGEARSRLSDKGIFNVTFLQDPSPPQIYSIFTGTTYSIKSQYNQRVDEFHYKYKIKVELASPITYSRLTNRFFPWIGFVNAKNSAHEKNDFNGYLNDLDKLGFPGKTYFMGASAKTNDAPHMGSFEAELFNANPSILTSTLKVAGLDIPKPEVTKLNNAVNTKLTGTASDYTAYLSDETLEFIPITSPYGGYFEYGISHVTDKLDLSKQSSYAFIAKTDLTYPYNGGEGVISPFEFNWPWNESEKTTFIEQQKVKQTELTANPQNYTGPTWDQKTATGGTWWDLDDTQITHRKTNEKASRSGSGQVRFDKIAGNSNWSTTESFGNLLLLPDYVDGKYTAVSNTSGIKINPATGDKNDTLSAQDTDTQGVAWTTADDLNLIQSNSLIRSPNLTFNDKDFKGTRTLTLASAYTVNDEDFTSANALKYTFLKYDPFGRDMANTPIDNPNVVIDSWDVKVMDRTGYGNKDIILVKVDKNDKRLKDTLTLKLKLAASESRYVEILGNASGPYELMYFDGNTWKTFITSNTGASGRLGWWNVGRLNGKYTVLLKSGGYIATKDVSIGTLIKNDARMSAYSTYKRAQLEFPANAFVNGSKLSQDQLVTITPVSINEIYIRNRPIIITSGPIVEIKPSPWKFELDKRPTLRFVYTFDELKELKVWDGTGTPANIPWNIHQVTALGDLQIINDNHQAVEENNGELQYAFYAPLDHFSTYALLPGKISLSAPMVFADRYITNKNSVTIYGTAEPGSIIRIYVKDQDIAPDVEKGEYYNYETIAHGTSGKFSVEEVKLLGPDGKNFIFVTSHLESNKNYRTQNSVVVEKDTIPPSIEAKANLAAFSPNSDGKYDSVDYNLRSNEKSNIYIQASSLACRQAGDQGIEASSGYGLVVLGNFSSEAEVEHKLNWSKDGFKLDNANDWPLLVASLADGEYIVTCYAIDPAGNISNNISLKTIVDTIPPVVQGLNADPNPFTPNDDGIKDTTKFWCKLSEPAYVNQEIYRDDGQPFRSHEGPTSNFVYAVSLDALMPGNLETSTGTWEWNGRGSHNELLGGTYTYNILATDWVGNSTSSEAKTVIVDCTPTLVPYLYAEPDPFSPVNPTNNFTDIKYYLARDNTKVKLQVVGQENQVLKTLVADDILAKGPHTSRWYGDFDSSYTGPSSSKNKYRVADGSYEFKISANDITEPGAKTAEVTNTVLVDNVPPQILIKDLKVDYLKKIASLVYSIPETASVEVFVVDNDGKTIASLVSGETQYSGDHSLKYYFGDTVSQQQFKLIAIDKAKNMDEKTSVAFDAIAGQLKIENHKANPQTFTPNSDNLSDQTLISYTLSGGVPEYKTSISILGPSGATIKRLIENETQSSTYYSFYWDGSTSSADGGLRRISSDGYYEYQIIAIDKLGTKIQASGIINLVSTKPSVDINLSTDHFSPNNDGAKDSITFNYSIDYPTQYITGEALVKIQVLNSSNEAVWEKIFNHSAGSYSYEYNGSLMPGSLDALPAGRQGLIPSGNYLVKISGQDGLGTMAEPKTVALTVDYAEPTVSILSVSPDLFSPEENNRKDTSVISYSLAKPANVSIDIRDSENQVIRNLLNNKSTNAYLPKIQAVPTVVWNGKDDNGQFVEDQEYLIHINATDEAGNASATSGLVKVDNTKPEAPQVITLASYTNEAVLPVIGTAEAGAEVEIYDNNVLAGSGNVSPEGNFGMSINLSPGNNEIKARVIDLAGNVTEYSEQQLVNYETNGPIITSFEVTPNPAKAGLLIIKFTVSETLESDPIVTINQETATFSRRFPDADSLFYEYTYEVTAADQQGMAQIKVQATDLAGNQSVYSFPNSLASSEVERLIVDTISPTVSNVDISSKYAKLGDNVTIDFSVSEELFSDPVVRVGSNVAAKLALPVIYSSDRIDYSYSYIMSQNDLEGINIISIEATDLAGNLLASSEVERLIVDFVSPEVSDFSVSPNPASVPDVSGQVSVKFKVNEELKSIPKVYVTQKNASTIQAAVSGNYEAKFNIIPGYDGFVLITIEAIDLAGNPSVYSFNNSLIADATLPAFSNIRSEVSSNADFSDFAKEASEVKLSFKTSESLKFNPEVKVNNNLANYEGSVGDEYTYKYVVPNNDKEGNALILISGFDFAGNEGIAETGLSSESFVIDLENPQVVIPDPATDGIIANPSPFSTNASAIAQERQTRLNYETSEYGLVTVKVHKVPEIKKASDLVKSDFNDSNLIDVLVNGVWLNGGMHDVLWNASIQNNQALYDKDNNGLADPGKYAFIVEVRDKAGNVTQKKWGGTVWIQDNCMRLKGPDQKEAEEKKINSNPCPSIISPNGNSPENKFSLIYFRVDLGVTPKMYERPEQISAQSPYDGISWEVGTVKLIGSYTVKIFDANNNLVRTIAADKPLSSGILITEKWDGKNDADSQFVANGTYTAKVEIKDFLGAGPVENILKLNDIIIDNTAPVVPIISAGPYYFAPGNTNSTIKTTTLSYAVSDNSTTSKVSINVYKGAEPVITIQDTVQKDNGTYAVTWEGDGSGGYVGTNNGSGFKDGIYTLKVTAVDAAGNTAELKSADVYVDTMTPTFNGNPSSRSWATNNILVTANVSDPASGINASQHAWGNSTTTPTSGWSGLTNGQVITQSSDGTWYLHFKAIDNAGNLGSSYFGPYYKDNVPPNLDATPKSRSWGTTDISISLSLSDALSDVSAGEYALSAISTTPNSGWSSFTDGTVISIDVDGAWYLHLRATDNAGKPASTYFGTYNRDTTAPNVSATPTSRSWAKTDISVALNANDDASDILTSMYAWSISPSTPTSWNNFSNGDVITQTGQGSWYLHLNVTDNVGHNTTTKFNYYNKDNTAPTISASPASRAWSSNDISVTLSISDAYSNVKTSKYAWSTSPASPPDGWSDFSNGDVVKQYSDGVWYLHIKADDNALNSASTSFGQYKKDAISPIINSGQVRPKDIFPDGVNGAADIYFSVSGANQNDIEIRSIVNDSLIKSFNNVTFPISWDARDNSGSLVPVGRYKVKVIATDDAGNSATAFKVIRVKSRDEIALVDDNGWGMPEDIRGVKVSPTTFNFNENFILWQSPVAQDLLRGPCLGDFDGTGKNLFVAIIKEGSGTRIYLFNIGSKSIVTSKVFSGYPYFTAAGDFDGDGKDELAVANYDATNASWLRIYRPLNDWKLWKEWKMDVGCWWLAAGDYDSDVWDEIAVIDDNGSSPQKIKWYDPQTITSGSIDPYSYQWTTPYLAHPGNTTPDYTDPYQYYSAPVITAGDINNDGAAEIAVSSHSGGNTATYYFYGHGGTTIFPVPAPPVINNGTLLKVVPYHDPNNTFKFIGLGDFQGDGKCELATVADDNGSDTWMFLFDPLTGQILPNGHSLPENCWRIACGDLDGSYAAVTFAVRPIANQSATIEAPSLIAPENDDQNVDNIRPTFQWKHHKGNTNEYRIDVAKNDSFSLSPNSFTKSVGAGSPDQTDSALFHYTYTIHEFDPGLDRDTYYWKVTALVTNEAATSEVWSFKIRPDFALTNVTNYPNPFNPNRETTKIRYRLGSDADSVFIKIYDIAGGLVRTIDNCPTEGELSSVWNKYHDVEWDGRNGRGDLVMNGVYVFQITATLGSQSQSATGKAAVLK